MLRKFDATFYLLRKLQSTNAFRTTCCRIRWMLLKVSISTKKEIIWSNYIYSTAGIFLSFWTRLSDSCNNKYLEAGFHWPLNISAIVVKPALHSVCFISLQVTTGSSAFYWLERIQTHSNIPISSSYSRSLLIIRSDSTNTPSFLAGCFEIVYFFYI